MRAYNNQPKQPKVRDEPSLPSRRHLRNPLPAGSSPAGLCSRHVIGRYRRPALRTGPLRDRPRRLMRPIGIRKALGCRQAGRVQGPPQSGPGRPARILAELRKCLRAGYVGTRDADTITRLLIRNRPVPGTCRFGNGSRNWHRPTRGRTAAMGRLRPFVRSPTNGGVGWIPDLPDTFCRRLPVRSVQELLLWSRTDISG